MFLDMDFLAPQFGYQSLHVLFLKNWNLSTDDNVIQWDDVYIYVEFSAKNEKLSMKIVN